MDSQCRQVGLRIRLFELKILKGIGFSQKGAWSRGMITLIDREFIVNASREQAWRYLARLDQWPEWARHIKRIEMHPQGELGPHSSGVIHLANGMKSTFHMTEFNPYDNWKWAGPFLWLTIHYDHRFEAVTRDQTKMRFILEGKGLGVGSLGRLFAKLYRQNLEKAIPLLVQRIENWGSHSFDVDGATKTNGMNPVSNDCV